MRKLSRWLMLLMFCLLIAITKKSQVQAFVPDNVNVTIPTKINMTFEEDGQNLIEKYTIKNHFAAPIWIENIQITSYNGWDLVGENTDIRANTKQLILKLGEQALVVGENKMSIRVDENSSRELSFEMRRGAWSYGVEEEKAFAFEIEYEIGQKEFQLQFNGNGSLETPNAITAHNGETVNLPKVTRAKHNFHGWQDEDGNIYTDTFVMPIGNKTLTAVWKQTEAYAIFSADDGSLTFVRLEEVIPVGSTYNGKTVTDIYGGIETSSYGQLDTPWEPHWREIRSIVAQDEIYPSSMEYWFMALEYVEYVDVGKFNVSNVKDMTATFSDTGKKTTGSFHIQGIGSWDVSNVEQAAALFRGMGRSTTQFYMEDVSAWDTSNMVDMELMFASTGHLASWSMDLREWNVSKVTSYDMFDYNCEGKLVGPKWVN